MGKCPEQSLHNYFFLSAFIFCLFVLTSIFLFIYLFLYFIYLFILVFNFIFFYFFKFYFIFKLYKIVLVLPNIKMNPPQVYMCSFLKFLATPPSV